MRKKKRNKHQHTTYEFACEDEMLQVLRLHSDNVLDISLGSTWEIWDAGREEFVHYYVSDIVADLMARHWSIGLTRWDSL